jgi:hypothetical protein
MWLAWLVIGIRAVAVLVMVVILAPLKLLARLARKLWHAIFDPLPPTRPVP